MRGNISEPNNTLKVFISYSRADMVFAEELVAGLEMQEFATSIDRHSIAAGEDWKKRLGNLILSNDTVVFVLSPNSAASEICHWEVEESARLSKRIIPVVCSPVDFKGKIPSLLRELNAIPMDGGRAISGLKQLVEALNTDVDWLRDHTRYAERAAEWDQNSRGDERLLRGGALTIAMEWLARKLPAAPDPTTLQRQYIAASEDAESERTRRDKLFEENQRLLEQYKAADAAREQAQASEQAARAAEIQALAERGKALEAEQAAQKEALAASQLAAEASTKAAMQAGRLVRRTMVGLFSASILSVVAAWFAFTAFQAMSLAQTARLESVLQREEAEKQRQMALQQQKLAEQSVETAKALRLEALFNQSRFLSAFSDEATQQGNAVLGLLLALEALPDATSPDEAIRNRPHWLGGEDALIHAVRTLRVQEGEVSLPTGQALIELAKTMTPRCLTGPQREQYFLPSESPAWCRTMGKLPN